MLERYTEKGRRTIFRARILTAHGLLLETARKAISESKEQLPQPNGASGARRDFFRRSGELR